MLWVAEGKHRARFRCQRGRNQGLPTPDSQLQTPGSMFPYKDENPTERPAVITVSIIIANVLAFILVQGAGAQGPLAQSVCNLGLIPAEILHGAGSGGGVELGHGMFCA